MWVAISCFSNRFKRTDSKATLQFSSEITVNGVHYAPVNVDSMTEHEHAEGTCISSKLVAYLQVYAFVSMYSEWQCILYARFVCSDIWFCISSGSLMERREKKK